MGRQITPNNPSEKLTFAYSDRFKYSINVTSMIFFAFVLLLMVNYIASRHYLRIDLTTYQKHTLSPKSIQLLETLPRPIQIFSIRSASQNPTVIYMTQFIKDLLEEFQSHSEQLQVVEWDYYKESQKIEKLSKELQEQGFKGELQEFLNTIVVRSAEQYKILSYGKFFNFERSKERPEFQGENTLSATLYELISEKPRRILFVTGHGELSIESDQADGLSLFREKLLQENTKIQVGAIAEYVPLIKHAEVLFIVGPRTAFSEEELRELALYLDSGGKMIVFFEEWETSNLNTLLGQKGITARNDQIQTRTTHLSSQIAVRRWFSAHPINRAFAQFSGYSAFFEGACSLSLKTNFTEYQVQSIAESLPETISILSSLRNNPREMLERTGPFPVAAVSFSDQMRLVVFGDTHFIQNGQSTGGQTQRIGLRDGVNTDLALNALNWCLEEENRLQIEAKPVDLRLIQVDVDTSQRIGVLLCLIIPFAIVGLYWIFFDWLRTEKIQEFLDILEDLLRHPSFFFQTSLSSFTWKKAILFHLEATLLFGILFYTIATHFGFPYILQSQYVPAFKPVVQKIVTFEEQVYQFSLGTLVEIPEGSSTTLKPNLRTAFLARSLQYFLLYGIVMVLLIGFGLYWGAFWWLILLIIEKWSRNVRENQKSLSGTILHLSLFPIQWLCPVLGFYSFYILFQGLKQGYGLSFWKSLALILWLVFCQGFLLWILCGKLI